MDDFKYREILVEIIDGSSTIFVKNKRIFIRHKSLKDVVDYDIIYKNSLEAAVSKGLPKEKDILSELKAADIWTQEEEDEIVTKEDFVERLRKNKKNVYLDHAIKAVDKQIDETLERISELRDKKQSLVSSSAESYATNRANDYYILNSLFKDREGKELFYTEEEYEYLDKNEMSSIVNSYNEFNKKFSEESIQNLVLQDFYKMYYSLSESCMDFFGKAALQLTNFQFSLFVYTRIFKNIFETSENIPDRILKDPKALLDFANSSQARQNAAKQLNKEDSAGASIVGASKEDIESITGGQASEGLDLHKEAMKKGGSLSMQDLMKLNGL